MRLTRLAAVIAVSVLASLFWATPPWRQGGHATLRPAVVAATQHTAPATTAAAAIDGRDAPAGSSAPPAAAERREMVLVSPTLPAGATEFDLLVHFHGDAELLRQSVEHVGIDAALAVVHLGIGSEVYRRHYQGPDAFGAVVEQVEQTIAERGMAGVRARRVALSSFSAGYGAVYALLTNAGSDPRLDAILVVDGIYSDWTGPRPRQVDKRRAFDARHLEPFVRAAQGAALGQHLFSISHCQLAPDRYAGPARTTRHLVAMVGGLIETVSSPEPIDVRLRSADYAVPPAHRLVPTYEAHSGQLHVRGFRGTASEDHQAQLLQMAATVLPDLATHWAKPR